MKTERMWRVSIGAAVTSLVCVMALSAHADDNRASGRCGQEQGQRGEFMHKRMAEKMEQRQAALKTSLQLTPAQEPAWQAFVQAMKPPAQPMTRPNPAELEAMTTPQRLEKMKSMRAEREARMDQRMQAIQTFYGALTPAQQKVFDAHKPMQPHGHHHRGEGEGHPGHRFNG